jgi:hypothetical protein
MRRATFWVAVALLGWSGENAAAASAEQSEEGSGSATRARVTGRIIDAGTGEPLAGSMVVLEPRQAGAVPSSAGGGSFLTRGWTALTDANGSYEFDHVVHGRYRLRVARIGYRPRSVDLELRRTDPVTLSVALTINPIPLEPIGAVAPPAAPFGVGQSRDEEIEFGRVSAVRARQARYLTTDVRSVTHNDVIESVTLGETDVLRAIQRLPGVALRDEFSAQPWVRGATPDHTRLYFDGMPLFVPVNGFGVVSGIGSEVLGGVFFEPGVRSASVGEGAAGVLELASRPAQGHELRGFGELSLASARLALDRRIGERTGVMVGLRRSYADAVAKIVKSISDNQEAKLPYAFHNVVGRVDYQLDDARAVNTSVLWSEDRIFGDLPDVTVGNHGSWGNLVAQTTITTPFLGLASRHTVGLTTYRSSVDSAPPDPDLEFSAPTAMFERSGITYASLAGEFEPTGQSPVVPDWRFGYRLVGQWLDFDGPVPSRAQVPLSRARTAWSSSLAYAALWGERRWYAGDRLTLETGLRLEAGAPVRNGGAVRVAPRVAAQFEIDPRFRVSAAVGRTYQYTQVLAASGIEVADGVSSSNTWLAANDTVPALRADMLQAGFEWWWSDTWLAGVNAYGRRTTGQAFLEPSSALVELGPRDTTFVVGEGWARGVEVSVRRLAGRWTASAAYGYTTSTAETDDYRFPSAADRRHTLSLSTMVRAGAGIRIGSTYRYASGFPFTRFFTGTECVSGICTQNPDDRQLDAPNAARGPQYSSLDFLFDWQHAFRAWTLGGFMQLRNVFNHDNRSAYQGSYVCTNQPLTPASEPSVCDQFQDGLPLVPIIGFRVTF